jgi:hypothetical protein
MNHIWRSDLKTPISEQEQRYRKSQLRDVGNGNGEGQSESLYSGIKSGDPLLSIFLFRPRVEDAYFMPAGGEFIRLIDNRRTNPRNVG